MRRQDYLRLYSQTRSSREQTQVAIQLPKDVIPSADNIIRRDTERARGFGQWVAIYQRTRGQADFMSTPFLVKTNQPITPAEAEQRALAFLETAPDEYDRITLGVGYMGSEQFFPRQ